MKKAGHTHTHTRKSRQNFGKNRDFVPIGLKLFDLEGNINIFRFVCTPMQFCVWEKNSLILKKIYFQEIILGKIRIGGINHFKKLQNSGNLLLKIPG